MSQYFLRKFTVISIVFVTCIGTSFYVGTKFITYKNSSVQKITNSEPESIVNLVPVVSPKSKSDLAEKQQIQRQEKNQEDKTQTINKESDDPITVQNSQENETESKYPQDISNQNTQYAEQSQLQEQQQKSQQLQKRQEQLIQYFEQQKQEEEALKQRQLRIKQVELVCLKQKNEAQEKANKIKATTLDGSDNIITRFADSMVDLTEDEMNINYKKCMQKAQLTS